MFPWEWVDGLWATKSEGVGLIVRAILVSKISNLCDPDPPRSQTDGQTDGRTTCNLNSSLCTTQLAHARCNDVAAT